MEVGFGIFLLLILLGGAALFVAIFALVFFILRKAGDWAKLAARYPAAGEPPGTRAGGQTLSVGAVQYKRCMTTVVSEQGLYLARSAALGFLLPKHPALLLPWGEFRSAEPRMLYWRKAVRLGVGEPRVGSITVFREFFDLLRPRLDPGVNAQIR